MMLTQETPTAPQTARRRTDWAKLFWMMKSSPLTLSLIHNSEPTRLTAVSRMPSSA